jgi:cholesterol transport system auxiliary component
MTTRRRETPRLIDRRRATWLLASTATLGLTACSVQLPGSGEPPRVFVLTPKSTFDDDLPNVEWQLLVEEPMAAAGISSARIALRRSLIELQYFARSAWTDSAPAMIQTLMIESFENTNRIISVGRQAIGLRSDYILKTDLREFQAEYVDAEGNELPEGAAPFIRIRMNAKLVAMPDRKIVASRTEEYVMAAPGPGMLDIVKGFDDALGKILKRLVSWTLREGERLNTAV